MVSTSYAQLSRQIFLLAVMIFLAGGSACTLRAQCPTIDYYNRVTNPTVNPRYIANGWDTAVTCDHTCLSLRDTSIVTTQSYNGTYRVESIPYAPADTSFCSTAGGGHQLPITTDDNYDANPITLPFGFVFFGRLYTQAVVGGNGVVSFGPAMAGQYCPWSLTGYGGIPGSHYAGIYGNAIFGILQDIHPGRTSGVAGQGIYVSVYDQFPCRKLVVSWKGIPHFNSGSSADMEYTTAQIVCYEGTNIIEVHVKRRVPHSSWDGGRGIIGIQDSIGTANAAAPHAFAAPRRNPFSSSITVPEAWRFTPQGSTARHVTWYYGTDTAAATCRPVENSDSATVYRDAQNSITHIDVCPTVTSTYTMRLRYTGANGIHYDLTSYVTVGVESSSATALNASRTTCCPGDSAVLTLVQDTLSTRRQVTWSCSNPRVSYTLSDDTTTLAVAPYAFADGDSRAYDTARFTVLTRFASGCSRTNSRTLRFVHAADSLFSAAVCEGSSYLFMGTAYDSAATYVLPAVTAEGCPYRRQLQLSLLPDSRSTVSDTIVENALPFSYLGATFAGDTTEALLVIPNAASCDSLVTFSLHVHRNVQASADSSVCQDALPLTWNGHLFPADSTAHAAPWTLTQTATLGAHTGADSLLSMQLLVQPTTSSLVFDTVVENRLPHTFLGTAFATDTSDALLVIPNSHGCDSLITYALHVHRNVSVQLDSTVCDSQLPLLWCDSIFLSATSKTLRLTTRAGADSVVTLSLHLLPTYDEQLPVTICADTVYSFADSSYAVSGAYPHLLRSRHGCDSLVTLLLTVHGLSASLLADTACDAYPWQGHRLTASGIYHDTLTNVLLCDSIVSLQLTLHHSDSTAFDQVSCGAYLWDGERCDTAGRYVHRLHTAEGCDSMATMRLILPVLSAEYADTACDLYLWNGQSYALSGDYQQQLVSRDGCDSLITLHLTLFASSLQEKQQVLCESDLPFHYGDTTFALGTVSGLYTFRHHDRHGCDSVIHLQLNVHYNPLLGVEVQEYLCRERQFVLAAQHTAQAGTLQWYCRGLLVGNGDTLHASPLAATTYTVAASVPQTDCHNSMDITLQPAPALTAAFTVSPPVATPHRSEIVLQDQSQGTVAWRQWLVDETSGATGCSADALWEPLGTSHNITYAYPASHDSVAVRLIVTEPQYLCRDTATAVIPYRGGDLWVPNAFTPGELSNGIFLPRGNNIVDYEIFIYDRNGILLFHSTDLTLGWDGTATLAGHAQSTACPQGTYVYLIHYATAEAPRARQVLKGSVLLLR